MNYHESVMNVQWGRFEEIPSTLALLEAIIKKRSVWPKYRAKYC